jgi:RecA-family ATPase
VEIEHWHNEMDTITMTETYADPSHRPLPRIPVWPGHYYRGAATLIAGPGAAGKGQQLLNAACRMAAGLAWPGEPQGTAHPRRRVILVTPEDDANEDIAPRIDATFEMLGVADPPKHLIIDLTFLSTGDVFSLDDPAWETEVRALIELYEKSEAPVGMLGIDPLMEVTEKVGTNAAARRTLRRVLRLAKDYGIVVAVIHHTTKDGKTIAGSAAVVQIMRIVFTVARDDPDDLTSPCTLHLAKANGLDASTVPDLRYRVLKTSDGQPYLNWLTGDATTAVLRALPEWRERDGAESWGGVQWTTSALAEGVPA